MIDEAIIKWIIDYLTSRPVMGIYFLMRAKKFGGRRARAAKMCHMKL